MCCEKGKGTKMNYKDFQKFFTEANKIPMIIGYALMALGAVGVIIRGFFLIIGVILIVAGLAVIMFYRDSRPSEAELDAAVTKKIGDLDVEVRREIGVHEKLIKAFPPITFAEYDFRECEGLLVGKGRDNRYRSNVYSAAELLFAQERLHIYMYQFRLTEERESRQCLTERYENLSGATVEHRTLGFDLYGNKEKHSKLEFTDILIKNNAGEVIFEMPVRDGADVDKTVDIINRLIAQRKSGQNAGAAE